MPSPAWMTVPTSLTSTLVSKPSICWRMILLISSALIPSIYQLRGRGVPDVYARDTAACEAHREPCRPTRRLFLPIAFFQSMSDILKLRSYRAVINDRPDARDHAAYKRGVGLEFELHLLAGHSHKFPAQSLPLCRANCLGRRDLCEHGPFALVHLAAELFID